MAPNLKGAMGAYRKAAGGKKSSWQQRLAGFGLTTTLQKAKIVVVDEDANPVGNQPGEDYITCLFNPNQIQYSRTSRWHKLPMTQKSLPEYRFWGGGPASLKVDLFFDTTLDLSGPDDIAVEAGDDVRKYTEFLIALMEIDPDTLDQDSEPVRPPYCQFRWGDEPYFEKGIITQVSVNYTMFLPNGTPVRAMASVMFEEISIPEKGQNPTSRSEARKMWVVEESQTLDWIAYREYGDPAMWRHIAETNGLDNPLDIRPGQVLKLVPLP